MEKVKARINKLKEDIEACEKRESESKALLSEANVRLESAESETNSFRRRLKILQGEVTKTNERLAERQERLNTLESKTAEHEIAVKSLEDQEVEGDERLGTLSDEIKRGQVEVETYDTQWREAIRKEVVLLNDVEKADSRFQENSSRIEHLMKAINNASAQIKDLEAREDDQSERDTLNEEKLAFLAEQYKEVLIKAEAGERDAARLERIIAGLEADIQNSKNKTADVIAEIDEVNNMVEDMD